MKKSSTQHTHRLAQGQIFIMDTLKDRQTTIEIQYVLESLIEKYYSVETESQRYLVKLHFMDFVIENIKNPVALLGYMTLQEDKFMPFISCLKGCKLSQKRRLNLPKECQDSESSIPTAIVCQLFQGN